MSLQVLLIGGLAFITSVYPMASWAVVAMSIQPQHEYEAAFCFGLLSGADTSISFDSNSHFLSFMCGAKKIRVVSAFQIANF